MKKIVADFRTFPKWIRTILWRFMHRVMLSRYGFSDLKFLNYGYVSLDPDYEYIELDERDELERYGLQLYNHTTTVVNLKGKDVLEVGSGRGGGASFITRYYEPSSYVGLDLSKKVIRFCNKNYKLPGLSFTWGDAENLPFDDSSFDAVVNIESSGSYKNMEKFLSEVYRVLRPSGHLLFADARSIEEKELLRVQFEEAGLKILDEENIVKNILKATDLDYERRNNLINSRAPQYMKKLSKEFSSLKGTKRYDKFNDGSKIYLRYLLKKS
ncbi:MAG: Phthiotriol/phenolphthiotriol dimycocerosates methyltransferase [Candidatus Heimdallarchaeota archaeon AB_125]|nr:MAG: Phthiotriol/phenolphthiotriol dimycocerosates methyltransferase [Candidatus Heimdallarchaeota archaeon AB_125]